VGGIFRFYIYFVPNFYVVVFQNLLASINGDFIVGDSGDVTRCCFGQIVCPLVSPQACMALDPVEGYRGGVS